MEHGGEGRVTWFVEQARSRSATMSRLNEGECHQEGAVVENSGEGWSEEIAPTNVMGWNVT